MKKKLFVMFLIVVVLTSTAVTIILLDPQKACADETYQILVLKWDDGMSQRSEKMLHSGSGMVFHQY